MSLEIEVELRANFNRKFDSAIGLNSGKSQKEYLADARREIQNQNEELRRSLSSFKLKQEGKS